MPRASPNFAAGGTENLIALFLTYLVKCKLHFEDSLQFPRQHQNILYFEFSFSVNFTLTEILFVFSSLLVMDP